MKDILRRGMYLNLKRRNLVTDDMTVDEFTERFTASRIAVSKGIGRIFMGDLVKAIAIHRPDIVVNNLGWNPVGRLVSVVCSDAWVSILNYCAANNIKYVLPEAGEFCLRVSAEHVNRRFEVRA
jgi:hypothetical protein